MTPSAIKQRAEHLLKLHHSGPLLVLPNVWDPLGAKMMVQAGGFPAVATASEAVAASLGYEDGERMPRVEMFAAVYRIARAVPVPVSADIEMGYGDSLDELRDSIAELLRLGVVGINIEDGLPTGVLREASEQAERIAAVRDVARTKGIHLVINARTDAFLLGEASEQERIGETVQRAELYASAGADCLYPVGGLGKSAITALRARITLPLNVLVTANSPTLAELQAIGVNRVSFGPYVHRACMAKLQRIAREVGSGHVSSVFEDTMPESEVVAYLRG